MVNPVDTSLTDALRDRYLLERELGRGGMATVYLAKDVKHQRRVALKVLHPELAAVLGSERFLKEIELTAHLQHPHILPLFDSGRVDGTVFYVMPFVQGESLRDRLKREKQLPVADAVRAAAEVASALDYAHRHGIIHRDIKPENILLHEGQALVADFGIALAASNAGGGARLTETGLSLGTPHYMSPEQAMGERELTARSDVYALGAVVYEMLSGEPPFTGPTAQSVVAKVLTEEPRGLVAQRRSVPEHVEAAVLTALEKLPADRFATAAEFAAALSGGAAVTRRTTRARKGGSAAQPTPDRSRWRSAAFGLAALWLLTAALALWMGARRKPASIPPTRRAVVAGSHGGDFRDTDIGVSADGRTIVALDGAHVVVRQVGRVDAIVVPGSDGADTPFLTGDGSRVGFRRERELTVQRLDGTEPVTIPFTTGLQASDAGSGRVIAVDSGGLVLLDLASSRREPLFRPSAGTKLLNPYIPPGGRHALVVAVKDGSVATSRILSVDLGSKAVDTLMEGGALRPQVADGRLFFVRPDGAIHAVGYDIKSGQVAGDIVQTGDVAQTQRTGSAAFAAGKGILVYGEQPVNRVVALTPDGRRQVLTPEMGVYHNPKVSPDGSRVVFDREVRGRSVRDIWVMDLADGALTRVTSAGDAHDAVWTADGQGVTYISLSTPGGPLFTTAADGSGATRPIPLPGSVIHPGQWLANGSGYVAGISAAEEDPSDIVLLKEDGSAPVKLVATRYNENSPAVSPDQRWLAYESDETGRRQVYVRPLGGGGRVLISEGTGSEPVWSRNGRLYYLEPGDAGPRLLAARIAPGPPPRVLSRDVVVDPFRSDPIANHSNWDMTADGRIVFVEPMGGGRLLMVTDWSSP
jgi:eukaryotic-like serine/threonine-protein kinase